MHPTPWNLGKPQTPHPGHCQPGYPNPGMLGTPSFALTPPPPQVPHPSRAPHPRHPIRGTDILGNIPHSQDMWSGLLPGWHDIMTFTAPLALPPYPIMDSPPCAPPPITPHIDFHQIFKVNPQHIIPTQTSPLTPKCPNTLLLLQSTTPIHFHNTASPLSARGIALYELG